MALLNPLTRCRSNCKSNTKMETSSAATRTTITLHGNHHCDSAIDHTVILFCGSSKNISIHWIFVLNLGRRREHAPRTSQHVMLDVPKSFTDESEVKLAGWYCSNLSGTFIMKGISFSMLLFTLCAISVLHANDQQLSPQVLFVQDLATQLPFLTGACYNSTTDVEVCANCGQILVCCILTLSFSRWFCRVAFRTRV
jgi:hypothetical protein